MNNNIKEFALTLAYLNPITSICATIHIRSNKTGIFSKALIYMLDKCVDIIDYDSLFEIK